MKEIIEVQSTVYYYCYHLLYLLSLPYHSHFQRCISQSDCFQPCTKLFSWVSPKLQNVCISSVFMFSVWWNNPQRLRAWFLNHGATDIELGNSWGFVLSIVGCLAASLACSLWIPVAALVPQLWLCRMFPEGKNLPQLRTEIALK